jgi:hypothetical protein
MRFSAKAQPNNSFNPTALSLPLINLDWCGAGCVVASGGGLIQALDSCCMLRLKGTSEPSQVVSFKGMLACCSNLNALSLAQTSSVDDN